MGMPDPTFQEVDGVPVEILLIEDDPGDVLITREAFAEHKLQNRLTVLTDGAQAIAYLRQEGRYAEAVRPDVILLDLNLPGIDGRAVLEALQLDPALRRIPVVVLTGSTAEEDVLRSTRLRVDTYIGKPVDFARLVEVVRYIETFFISVVKVAEPL